MTHSEYKYWNGQFHFIEMSARGGGVFIGTSIVPYVSGIDNVKHYILSATDKKYNAEISYEQVDKTKCGILKFFDCNSTDFVKVKAIRGLEYLRNTEAIIKYELFFKEGDSIIKL